MKNDPIHGHVFISLNYGELFFGFFLTLVLRVENSELPTLFLANHGENGGNQQEKRHSMKLPKVSILYVVHPIGCAF